MLTDDQELSLTSGGDCTQHYHSADRDITHEQVLQFQGSETLKLVTASRTVSYEDDFLFVSTVGGAVTLMLPIARGGKAYTVVRLSGASSVTLTPAGTDTINGAGSLVISANYSPVRLKALKGTGWIQV